MIQPLLGLLILVSIVAFGDIISNLTKARIPMLAVALLTYMLLAWAGMPKDLLEIAHVERFAGVMVPILVVHMGTMLPFEKLKEQWKAVLISLGGVAGIVILCLGLGTVLFGYPSSVAAVGPLTGGLIAGIITMEGLDAAGFSTLVVITGVSLAIQGFIGMPLASNILKKRASKIKTNSGSRNESKYQSSEIEDQKGLISFIPDKYFSNIIILLFAIAGGTAAVYLEGLTRGAIDSSIFALIIGILGSYFGFFHRNILDKSNSFGITMLLLLVYVLPMMMNRVTPEMFTTMIGRIIILMVLGSVGMIAGSYSIGRLVGWKWSLSIPVASTAFYGFPGNYLLCKEVARTVGKYQKHEEAIMDELLSPMLVGGYTTITTSSIIIASVLVGTL